MILPAPSQVRAVRLYRERAPMRSRGLVGPTTRYKLPALYPLSPAWSWADARGWCRDGIWEVLVPPSAVGFSPNDDKLLGFEVGLSADGMHVGFQPRIAPGGLSANTTYVLTLHLIGATTGKEDFFQILFPTTSLDALPEADPTVGTFNGDAFQIAGVQIYTGAST